MLKELKKPSDLFLLSVGNIVTKRNLFDLIQYSKVADSQYWGGEDMQIGNTPQQGINWVGKLPACHAVIIKTKSGSYQDDGWENNSKTVYHYSFKVRGGEIYYLEKANTVLINQPQYQYLILLFTDTKGSWVYEGTFAVSEIESKYIVLQRGYSFANEQKLFLEENLYQEGNRKYVTHLMVERNKKVIKILKANSTWICDICLTRFAERYGVEYIEAHHKTPVSTYSARYVIKAEDFALLCPNCHRAVHIYMKKEGLDYSQIREKLKSR